jgi:hypothetical protein
VALDCPVGAVLVVVLAEGAELGLQVRHGGGGRLLGRPAFLGLVESLDRGSGLARMEIHVALEEWLKRIPEFTLDPAVPVRWTGGKA